MDHSGDGDFFYFLFCEMIECRDDSSCADHGYNSADSDSYRAAGIDEPIAREMTMAEKIKKIFSETHVLPQRSPRTLARPSAGFGTMLTSTVTAAPIPVRMMARTRTRSRIPIWSGAGKIRSKMVIKRSSGNLRKPAEAGTAGIFLSAVRSVIR